MPLMLAIGRNVSSLPLKVSIYPLSYIGTIVILLVIYYWVLHEIIFPWINFRALNFYRSIYFPRKNTFFKKLLASKKDQTWSHLSTKTILTSINLRSDLSKSESSEIALSSKDLSTENNALSFSNTMKVN